MMWQQKLYRVTEDRYGSLKKFTPQSETVPLVCQCGHALHIPALNEAYYKTRIQELEEQICAKDQQITMLINCIPHEQQMITPSDAALVLDVNKGTVSRMADRGDLKDNGIKGAGRMISKTSVYDYLERQKLKQKAADYDDIMADDKNIRKMR